MKRNFFFIISPFALLLIALLGCNDTASLGGYRELDRWMEANGKLKVLSTTGMIDELVKAIGGDRVDHISLILVGLDPHSYELVKGDEEKFSCADVIFYNGLGLEHGASLAYKLKMHGAAYSLGESVRQKDPNRILEENGQIDPHIWMDISLWNEAAGEVVNVLSTVDPQNGSFYRERGVHLVEKMHQVHLSLVESLHEIPQERRYLVTSHDAFNYFVRAYFAEPGEKENGMWSLRFSSPEGLVPDGKLSSARLNRVIDFLKQHRIGCVFPESNVNGDSLRKIEASCLSEGHPIRISKEPLYGDSVGSAGMDGEFYLTMMRHNAEIIKKELL